MSALNLRLDDNLHQALRDRAEAEGRSVNTLLIRAAEEYLRRHTENQEVRRLSEESTQRWAHLLERLSK